MNENRKITVELAEWQWEIIKFVLEEDMIDTQITIDQANYDAELAKRKGNEYRATTSRMLAAKEERNKAASQEVLNEINAQTDGK